MVNGHRNKPIKEYNDLEEHFFSLAPKIGLKGYSPEQLKQMEPLDRFELYFKFEDQIREYLQQEGLNEFPLPIHKPK